MPFVYVMNRPNGHVKIGFSHQPAKRLLQVPDAISILAAWQHDLAREIERAAHRLLQDARQDGEWFAVDRYVAFDAISRAMRQIDGPPLEVIKAPSVELPAPAALGVDEDGYNINLGYTRGLHSISADDQARWMVESGVDPTDIYTDTDPGMPQWMACLKDFRQGDTLLIWSARVVEPATLPLELSAIAANKGGRIVFAHQELF